MINGRAVHWYWWNFLNYLLFLKREIFTTCSDDIYFILDIMHENITECCQETVSRWWSVVVVHGGNQLHRGVARIFHRGEGSHCIKRVPTRFCHLNDFGCLHKNSLVKGGLMGQFRNPLPLTAPLATSALLTLAREEA